MKSKTTHKDNRHNVLALRLYGKHYVDLSQNERDEVRVKLFTEEVKDDGS